MNQTSELLFYFAYFQETPRTQACAGRSEGGISDELSRS